MGKTSKKAPAGRPTGPTTDRGPPSARVSVVTPTREKRLPFLDLLAECILSQTLRPSEWVVVGGDADNAPLRAGLDALYARCPGLPPLVWVDPAGQNRAIGHLRQLSNEASTGDFVVCMDDDDYYPPERVEHAVHMMRSQGAQLAGCTKHIMYDVDTQTLVQFKGFHAKHGTNNTLAYTREYARTHRYDPQKVCGEEPSFTNAFSEPMVQLTPAKTTIQISHYGNTFSKRKHMQAFVACAQPCAMVHPNAPEKRLWPRATKQRYVELVQRLFPQEAYDVAYYLGPAHHPSARWLPTDTTKVGGSEQAVLHLTSRWAKQGKRVAVYGEFGDEDIVHDGVLYTDWKRFSCLAPHALLVVWRFSDVLHFPLAARRIALDLHDKYTGGVTPAMKHERKVDVVMTKSEFHRSMFLEHFPSSRHVAIPNGVRDEFLMKGPADDESREPFRFIYCSHYARGLEIILRAFFPIIRKLIPEATLHVFYGMDLIDDEGFKAHMRKLLQQPGVTEYGKQPMQRIVEEKRRADFHLYLTQSTAETDCISIKESAALGCVPLLANEGVYRERPGLHVDWETLPQGLVQLCETLKDRAKVEELRAQCRASAALLSWDQVAALWTNHFAL